MNVLSQRARFVAAIFCFALPPAGAADPGAATAPTETARAPVSALVVAAVPAVQDGARAPAAAAAGAAAPVPQAAVDWHFAPRRPFHVRRR